MGILHRFEEALDAYWRALKIQPENATVYYHSGIALKAMGKISAAEATWRRAIAIRPDFHEALNNLGLLLMESGRLEESIQVLNQSLATRPNAADVLNNLSNPLKDLGRTDEAVDVLQRAIAIKPNDANAHSNLGGLLARMARVDESLQEHRRAIELDPNDALAHSNLIFGMNFHPAYDAAAIFARSPPMGSSPRQAIKASDPPAQKYPRSQPSPAHRSHFPRFSPARRGVESAAAIALSMIEIISKSSATRASPDRTRSPSNCAKQRPMAGCHTVK